MIIFFLFSCALFAQEKSFWYSINAPLRPNTLIVHNGFLFEGSDSGVARTKDFGKTWEVVNKGLTYYLNPSPIAVLCSYNNKLFAAGEYNEGLAESLDNGLNWADAPIQNNGSGFTGNGITAFLINKGFIFAAVNSVSYARSNDGITWAYSDTSYGELDPFGHDIDATCEALAGNDRYIFAGNDRGNLYRSANNGDHWEHIFEPQNPKTDVTGLLSLLSKDTIVLAGFNTLGLRRSTNNGDTWDSVGINFIPLTFACANNIVFAGGYYGMYYSLDFGLTWQQTKGGMPDSLKVVSLAIQDDYIFCAGNSYNTFGIWRCSLSDFKADVKPISTTSRLTLKPNPTTGYLKFTNITKDITAIRIFNTVGQKVLDYQNVSGIDISTLPSGLYYINFLSANTSITEKLLKR